MEQLETKIGGLLKKPSVTSGWREWSSKGSWKLFQKGKMWLCQDVSSSQTPQARASSQPVFHLQHNATKIQHSRSQKKLINSKKKKKILSQSNWHLFTSAAELLHVSSCFCFTSVICHISTCSGQIKLTGVQIRSK